MIYCLRSPGTNLTYQMSSNDLWALFRMIISLLMTIIQGLLREAEYNVKNYPYPAEFNYYVIVDLKYF